MYAIQTVSSVKHVLKVYVETLAIVVSMPSVTFRNIAHSVVALTLTLAIPTWPASEVRLWTIYLINIFTWLKTKKIRRYTFIYVDLYYNKNLSNINTYEFSLQLSASLMWTVQVTRLV